ncbi:MAG: cysteine desulfurase family protein [Planctomycetota bacterium]
MDVYLDHNATSPLRPEARAALIEALDRVQGNASSAHAAGREARTLLDEARERVAGALGILEDEILFTSGGTEADNLALLGGLASLPTNGKIITTSIEHPAVLVPTCELERRGRDCHRLAVDPQGRPDLEELLTVSGPADLLALSVANGEVGTTVDLAGLESRWSAGNRPGVLFTDAVQALGRIPVDLRAWGVHFAAFSAHKVGGPTGIGVLYRRQGTPLEPRLWGGGQEGGLRAGTENVPGIVAASVAIELAVKEQPEFASRTSALMAELYAALRAAGVDFELNGPEPGDPDRLPNTLNVRLPHVDGRVLVTRLDRLGLQASAGSACASGSIEPSPVLKALGQTDQEARAGLRLSSGRTTIHKDIHTAVDILSKTITSAPNS